MAIFAGALRNVSAMAEENIIGNLVDAGPLDRLPTGHKGGLRMTWLAGLGLRKGHRLSWIGIRMASGALQFQIARVKFMAIRNRLLRARLSQGGARHQNRQQDLHRSPFCNNRAARIPLAIAPCTVPM